MIFYSHLFEHIDAHLFLEDVPVLCISSLQVLYVRYRDMLNCLELQ